MRRVVLTGLGLVSVLGCTRETVTKALYHGRSGLIFDPGRKDLGFASCLTGQIKDFDPGRSFTKKERKSLPDFALQACAASFEAIRDAGLSAEDLPKERTGIIFGNDSAFLAPLEQAERLKESGRTSSLGSGQVFRGMNSTVSMHLSVFLGIQGPCFTVSCACASGALALGQAFDQIRLGRLDCVLCGASQELNAPSVAAFDGLNAFSLRTDAESASRPFDKDRDGLVPSGGACALLLEERELALARNAVILGEILGFGTCADGFSLTRPSEQGLARAMQTALSEAGLAAGDLSLVSCHATSTCVGDAAEAANLRAVFAEKIPRLTALKSLTGHEFWMSGASQLAYTALMAQAGFTAATKNFVEGDLQTKELPVLTERLEEPPKIVLHNAQGFGGVNACLVVRYT